MTGKQNYIVALWRKYTSSNLGLAEVNYFALVCKIGDATPDEVVEALRLEMRHSDDKLKAMADYVKFAASAANERKKE